MKKKQSGACGSYSFLFNCLLRIDYEVTRSLKLLRLWEGFLYFHPDLFAASLILFNEDTGPTVDSNQRYISDSTIWNHAGSDPGFNKKRWKEEKAEQSLEEAAETSYSVPPLV